MARKQLDDADENLITALAPLADRLPSQIPEAERSSRQGGHSGATSSLATGSAAPAPAQSAQAPATPVDRTPQSVPTAAPPAAPVARQALNTRVAKRSYTLPDYVEVQLHEAAYRTGLSKGAVILKALKADGFAIRDEDIRDRRKRVHPT